MTAGAPVEAVAGQTVESAVVAAFTDADPARTEQHYSAEIHWGDGTSSPGTVERTSPGNFEVRGAHTYDRAGVFGVTVNVTAHYYRNPSQPSASEVVYCRTVGTRLTAVVAPEAPAPELTGLNISTEVGAPLPGPGEWTALATFAASPDDADRYTAEVFLGTGSQSVAAFVEPDPVFGGLVVVVSSDTYYQLPGTYTARVVVRDTTVNTEPGGAVVATADATVTVADPFITDLSDLTGAPLALEEGDERAGLVQFQANSCASGSRCWQP